MIRFFICNVINNIINFIFSILMEVFHFFLCDTHRVWMMRSGLVLTGNEPNPLKLQSAWDPLQRQDPRHSVRFSVLLQSVLPGSRWSCQESRFGLTDPSIRTRRNEWGVMAVAAADVEMKKLTHISIKLWSQDEDLAAVDHNFLRSLLLCISLHCWM